MSDPSREAQRARLLRERESAAAHLAILIAQLHDIVEAAGSTTGDDEHDPEGSTIAFERAQIAALIGRAREQLGEIEEAALRVEDGSYGICLRCGSAIVAERLAARPAATVCVRCAR